MLNSVLQNVEFTPYDVHEPSMQKGDLHNVELTQYNIHEHMLESNTQIHEGKSGVNTTQLPSLPFVIDRETFLWKGLCSMDFH